MIRIDVARDLAPCFAIRRAVFIEEQAIPEAEEFDAIDNRATHFLGWWSGQAAGTARVYVDGPLGKIGRVAVLPMARGTGLGAALVRQGILWLQGQRAVTVIRLSAQVPVIGFYEKLGFVAHGPEYDDAGIPHRDMDYQTKP